MLFQYISQYINPIDLLLRIPGVIIALSFHEFAHAMAADKLGDPTPREKGRLTAEPLLHLDFFGFLLTWISGFGWGKPVPIDIRKFKNPTKDHMLVSAAGPTMNFALAIIFTILLKIMYSTPLLSGVDLSIQHGIWIMLQYIIKINIALVILNFLPIYPLDGFHIMTNFVPYYNRLKFYRFQRYGQWILIVLVLPLSPFFLAPIRDNIYGGIMRLFNLPL